MSLRGQFSWKVPLTTLNRSQIPVPLNTIQNSVPSVLIYFGAT